MTVLEREHTFLFLCFSSPWRSFFLLTILRNQVIESKGKDTCNGDTSRPDDAIRVSVLVCSIFFNIFVALEIHVS